MNKHDFSWPGRSEGNPAHDLIIAYLTIDIQQSPQWTKELLQQIKRVKSCKIASWERTGNAYCLHIYPNYIEIEDDYADESGTPLKISLDDFAAAAKCWQQYVKNGISN